MLRSLKVTPRYNLQRRTPSYSFGAVQALAVLAAGDGFVELAAPISLSVRFMPRTAIGVFDSIIRARFLDASVEEEIPPPPRRDSRCAEFPAHADEVIAWRAFAAMHESESGTYRT